MDGGSSFGDMMGLGPGISMNLLFDIGDFCIEQWLPKIEKKKTITKNKKKRKKKSSTKK